MSAQEFASTVLTWLTDIQEALAAVDDGMGGTMGDRVTIDPAAGAAAVGPSIIIDPPTMTFATMCADGPSDVSVLIYVVADPGDDQMLSRMLAIALAAGIALEAPGGPEVSVSTIRPGIWVEGATTRPAYVLVGEGSLT